jgi:hypothetical protein
MSKPPATEPCPYCGKQIRVSATRCQFCNTDFKEKGTGYDPSEDAAIKWLVPVGRSGWSIAAGYLGLLSCFPLVGLLFGIGAVFTGILALSEIRKNRELGGKGRAIFGIVMGVLGAVFYAVLLVLGIAEWLQHRHARV